jgi:hypothetical protein
VTAHWLALVSALVSVTPAQERVDSHVAGMPSVAREGLVVSIVTVGPGPKVASHFGHTAIRVIDRVRGTDLLYDYGHFDRDTDRFGRSVQIQTLNLTPSQRVALRDFLDWNVRPENRSFTYDYFRDNCTTRVRDAVNLALDGALRNATDSVATPSTYRDLTLTAWRHHPVLGQGVSVILGRPADRPLSAWEAMFLPHLLSEALSETEVAGRPLVQTTYVVSDSNDVAPVRAGMAPAVITIGIVLSLVLLATGRSLQASRKARLIFAVVSASWGLLIGVAGTLLAGLWTLTIGPLRETRISWCSIRWRSRSVFCSHRGPTGSVGLPGRR